MSSRSAARGREAARSIRLALRTSSIVAVSSASPSRCFLFWPGRRARIASPIVRATVAIPPTTPPHPLPIRRHAPRRRLERAAQETMGGEPRGASALRPAGLIPYNAAAGSYIGQRAAMQSRVVSTESVPGREQFALWREAFQAPFGVRPEPDGRPPDRFGGQLETGLFGPVVWLDVRCDPHTAIRHGPEIARRV